MGRRTRKRRSTRARRHPLLLLFVLLCGLAAAGYLLDQPMLLAVGGLGVGLIGLIKLSIWHHRRQTRLAATRSLDKLLALSPAAFEETMAELLRRLGYRQVRRIGGPGDRGVDIIGRDDKGRVVVVQCKRYALGHRIGSEAIQSFIGMIVQHRAESGLFVTTSRFTRPAIELARDAPVPLNLIDGQEIVRLAAAIDARGAKAADLMAKPQEQVGGRPAPSPASPRRKQARSADDTRVRPVPARVCPICGHRCRVADRFCGRCGSTLVTSGVAARPEIAGFPPPSDSIDRPW